MDFIWNKGKMCIALRQKKKKVWYYKTFILKHTAGVTM